MFQVVGYGVRDGAAQSLAHLGRTIWLGNQTIDRECDGYGWTLDDIWKHVLELRFEPGVEWSLNHNDLAMMKRFLIAPEPQAR